MNTRKLYKKVIKLNKNGSDKVAEIYLINGTDFEVECTRGGNASNAFPIKTFTRRNAAVNYACNFVKD